MTTPAADLASQLVPRDQAFFAALVARDAAALGEILAPDFVLVDLSGALSTKDQLIASVERGELTFVSIVPQEPPAVRAIGGAGVVLGRTAMRVQVPGTELAFNSRYTHVFSNDSGTWRLAAAQGTPIQQP